MTENTPTPGQEPSRPADEGLPPVPPAAPPAPDEPVASSESAAPGSSGTAPPAEPVLDDGTYSELREPRSEGRLSLDGTWHQISPKYVVSQTVQNAIFLAIVLIAAVVVSIFADGVWWPWPVAGALVVVTVVTQIVLPRQARALGYMLRGDDLVFRKGILWQRMVAVPYGRMQLVDITHGPMDRGFGIAKLKMITAAATTGVEIPGLGQEAAEALRDTLIEVAETRRSGL